MTLDDPVTRLKGVGPQLAQRLGRLGVTTLQDLLFHLPLRYQDRTRVVPIGGLRPGDEVLIEGEIALAQVRITRRRSLIVRVMDGSGGLDLRLFHFSRSQQQQLVRGRRIRCFGEVRRGPAGLEMVHPEYQLLAGTEPEPVESTLTPVYPTTEGVGQPTLRRLIGQLLALLQQGELVIPELLPAGLLEETGYPPLVRALLLLHRPPPDIDAAALAEGRHPLQQRLAFEELLAHQLSLRQLRRQARRHRAPVLAGDGALRRAFLEALPFEPTAAQRRVAGEIEADLQQGHPMLRLVQGDVGSGKTVVAALAVLQAVEAGCQAALMAPTELLAEQHLNSFRAWLEPLGVPLLWLSGKLKGAARREAVARLRDMGPGLVVGTHALFQEDVEYRRLGLVVIDEQHRFGVHQRLALRDKGSEEGLHPHQLVMTATPIPRTLAMTAYADLDLSVIDELPPGRKPVTTAAVPDSRRAEVIERIAVACREGRQVYWVCTLIEESEALQCQAATDTASELAASLEGVRVGLIHGRMAGPEKEAVMRAFAAGEIDLLVATTVIEVGVDVPNASLMIIENAERLGLAQLHQLRGRVGRGERRSDCLLLYHPPLGENARARLAILRETCDGFAIARRDLELRGPGELLGTRQAGLARMRIADLLRDGELVPEAARAAAGIEATQPQSIDPLVRRWVRDAINYGHV